MALLLEKYVKKSMMQTDWDTIETAWLHCWKEHLGNPSHLPCKVMKAYLEYMDISTDVLNDQMDWECWRMDDVMEGDIDAFGVEVVNDLPLVL